MHTHTIRVLAIVFPLCAASTAAQSPKAATYITDEEVKTVNREAGVDRTIRVVDIGNENLAVGIIHRSVTSGATMGAAPASGRAATPAGEPCGEQAAAAPAGDLPSGIAHDSQTESYVIVSGAGTLITGGHIVNGRKSAATSDVTTVLNGPSCSGLIAASDVVRRPVKAGDIIIIPAGVPHGWTGITEHVDYLSIRPSDHVLQAGYVHPSIKK